MSLSEKSEEELSSLLTEYGIKHGPIVDSTRRLYERKLEKAMEEDAAKPSSDKTYYREEEDEVTYITYHSSVKHEEYSNMSSNNLKQRGPAEPEEEDVSDNNTQPPVERSHRAANHRAAPPTARTALAPKKSGSVLWSIIKGLMVLAVLALALYYLLYRTLENADGSPDL
ncbi:emerin (Emery-Dreifuss muscular dystrophy) isoform X1 [Gouania willdenowi]|uniref:Emerin homolog 1-like n=1 Tax=Gouania willdenowi TaxID=441366 RepID=A0A8C5DVK1_GOUWI|nr:emerin homolog 1-like isoform X1 [Gouania willdenowi]